MAAPEKATIASSHSLSESGREDWIDREIASLRQSVEGEASRQRAPDPDAHAESELRRLHTIRSGRTRDPIASRVLRPPTALLIVLGRARRFVRRRRFAIVFYGLCVAFTIAVVLLAVSNGGR
jgi:hypothetical protein